MQTHAHTHKERAWERWFVFSAQYAQWNLECLRIWIPKEFCPASARCRLTLPQGLPVVIGVNLFSVRKHQGCIAYTAKLPSLTEVWMYLSLLLSRLIIMHFLQATMCKFSWICFFFFFVSFWFFFVSFCWFIDSRLLTVWLKILLH